MTIVLIKVGKSDTAVGPFHTPRDANEWATKNVDARLFPWKLVELESYKGQKARKLFSKKVPEIPEISKVLLDNPHDVGYDTQVK
jgi:hypothetical protein